MRETSVARIYAETLLELAREREAVDRIAEEVEALRQVLRETPLLKRFLESPRVGEEEKKNVLRKSLGERLSEETLRFLEVVLDKDRQDLLEEILQEFEALIAELRKEQVVEVVSAVPLADRLRERLKESFGRATGRTIVLRERVDPSLMGGLIVRVGDRRIDGSVRTRLENLRERMLRGARTEAAA